MAKLPSPLLGYNDNVRYRGRVFHIQTEDSGVGHPHVITHLFMDGGRILKSVKRSYAEHVGTDALSETVRSLMKEQHKALIGALRGGELDALIGGGGARTPGERRPLDAAPPSSGSANALPAATPPAATPPAATPPAATPPARRQTPIGLVPPAAPMPGHTQTALGLAAAAPAPSGIERRPSAPYFDPEPPLPPELEALLRYELPPADAALSAEPAAEEEAPATTREPPRPEPAVLTLDFDELERDSGPSAVLYRADLPPPPGTLFSRERRTGAYRTLEPTREEATLPGAPPAAPRTPTQRPWPARDDAVREKTLDEVILSYLAEDLDPPKR